MSFNSALSNPAFKDFLQTENSEEWNNFMQKVTEVSSLVKDLTGADKDKADAAKAIADKYIEGKIISDDDIYLEVKSDRTVVNQKAFKKMGKEEDSEKMDPEVWMAEMSKDAERRYQDKKVRLEKADTFKTQAVKAYRRGEYERALSCYNKAIEQIKDNTMFYCDRALTNMKLGRFEKVFADCDFAIRLNENSFKARLYKTKAYLELEEDEKYQESFRELEEMFPQHKELTDYFLKKEIYEAED